MLHDPSTSTRTEAEGQRLRTESSETSTVFIVDDDRDSHPSLVPMVESMGLATKTFGSAEDFLQHLDANQPGCLVTELDLPGMGGLERLDTRTSASRHS